MANLVDKLEQMLGSYGPHPKGEPYIKNFDSDHSPSGGWTVGSDAEFPVLTGMPIRYDCAVWNIQREKSRRR